MKNEKSVEQVLIQARDSLTAENWSKGDYFSQRDGNICMCAHGAVQAIINDDVISALNNFTSASRAARLATDSVPSEAVYSAVSGREDAYATAVAATAASASASAATAAAFASASAATAYAAYATTAAAYAEAARDASLAAAAEAVMVAAVAADGAAVDEAADVASARASAAEAIMVADAAAAEAIMVAADAADAGASAAAPAHVAASASEGRSEAAHSSLFAASVDDWSFVAKRGSWTKGLEAHYVMGLAGLLASFNDAQNTTLEEVRAKFDEAIALIPLIKEYL